MKSIFRYPGGKTRGTIQRWILSHAPSCMGEYREPFVGGGGIFFHLKPKSVRSRWINDRCEGLVAVYRALADRPEAFMAACRAIEPARPDDALTDKGIKGGKPMNARLKAVFDELRLNIECDQALRYFFVNRTVFGGRVNYDRPSRLYFSKPEGWDIINSHQLEDAAQWLSGTEITCGDFEPVFDRDGDDVWIYADPPYWSNTGFTGNSKLYQHSFTEDDHRRLKEAVKRCKHNVCLSYDDDKWVRSLYPESEGFHIVPCHWAYCGSTSESKVDGQELLILHNYEPSTLFILPLPNAVPPQITEEEDGELTALEREVNAACEDGKKAFLRLGAALLAIQQAGPPKERLYQKKYKTTFAAYVDSKWGIKKAYLFRLINASTIVHFIEKSTEVDFLPTHEKQVQHLAKLKDEEGNFDSDSIPVVWQRAVEHAKEQGRESVTEEIVLQEVRAELGWKPPEKPSEIERILRQIRNLGDDKRAQIHGAMLQEWPELWSVLEAAQTA